MIMFCRLDPFRKGNPNIETITIDTTNPDIMLDVTLKTKGDNVLSRCKVAPTQFMDFEFDKYLDEKSIIFLNERLSKELVLKAEYEKKMSLSKSNEQANAENKDVKPASKLSFLSRATQKQPAPSAHPMMTRSKAAAMKL